MGIELQLVEKRLSDPFYEEWEPVKRFRALNSDEQCRYYGEAIDRMANTADIGDFYLKSDYATKEKIAEILAAGLAEKARRCQQW